MGWWTGTKKCWDRQGSYRVQVYTGAEIHTPTDAMNAYLENRLMTITVAMQTKCECY
jgi:hypothetical protein